MDISTRGLIEGGTPLREFKGKFDGYEQEDTSYGKTRVHLHFTDVDVIQSLEPYNFPVADIPVNYSARKGSSWGIFAESLNKLIADDEDIKDQKGKVFHMLMTPDHKFGTDKDGNEIVASCWEVQSLDGQTAVAVAGAPKVSASDRALELLDGKSLTEWHKIVYTDDKVKADATLIGQITAKTFVAAAVKAGKVTKDAEDVYHLVK